MRPTSSHRCWWRASPLQAHDLELLTSAAKNAGEIAKTYFQNGHETWDKPGGAGPVTEADLAVNDMLTEELRAARPDYGWLSEESENDSTRLSKKRTFVVDPIDGTRAFIDGSKSWSHALAILEDGIPIAAAVYLPMLDKLYTAMRGTGAHLNGAPITVDPETQVQDARVLANKNNFRPELWHPSVPPVKQDFRSSLAYRMCLVAEGRFNAMLTLRQTWEWDIASGVLIVEEAGGHARTRDGLAPKLNNPHPQINGVLAANPSMTKSLIDALAPPKP